MASAPSIFRSRSSTPRTSTPPAGHEYHGPNYAARPVQSQGPGLFGQMASTAAGVAVGSAVGHTIGAGLTGLFGGSRSEQPVQQEAAPAEAAAPAATQTDPAEKPCAFDAQNLARCLEDSDGDITACDYYMQMLKSCKAASKEYTGN